MTTIKTFANDPFRFFNTALNGTGRHCLFRCGAGRAACLLTVRAPLVDEINRMGSK
jgi:hypothetical protein